jgi:hypothetical protein
MRGKAFLVELTVARDGGFGVRRHVCVCVCVCVCLFVCVGLQCNTVIAAGLKKICA